MSRCLEPYSQQKTPVIERGLGTNIGGFLPLEMVRNISCEFCKSETDLKLCVCISQNGNELETTSVNFSLGNKLEMQKSPYL